MRGLNRFVTGCASGMAGACGLGAAVVVAGLTLGSSAALAQDTTWTNGFGDNMWSEGLNWTNGQPDGFEDVTILPDPIPGGAATTTITLDTNEFVTELRFDTGGYTLTGGDIFVLNGRITANGSGNNPTIASEIQGFAGLTKLGNRPLHLQGNNTYSGATVIQEDALDVSGADERLPDGTAVIVNSGTFLRFFSGTSTETIGSLAGSGRVQLANTNLGGTNLRVGFNDASTTFSGNIEAAFGGDGSLTKIGTGSLTLSGSNAYTGTTDIQAGSLIMGPAGSDSVPNQSTVNIASGATLDLDSHFEVIGGLSGNGDIDMGDLGHGELVVGSNNTSTIFNGRVLNDGVFEKVGTEILTIGNDTPYGADVQIADGTLRVGGLNTLIESIVTIEPSGTLQINGGVAIDALQGSGSVDLAGGVLGIFSNITTTYSGVISGSGGTGFSNSLIRDDSGTLILTGANTYTGGTEIREGTIAISSDANLGASTASVRIEDGTLQIQAGSTFTTERKFTFDGNNGRIDTQAGAHLTIGASGQLNIPLTNAGFTKAGPGTLTLQQTHPYQGATRIEGGVLEVSKDDNLGDAGAIGNDVTFVGGTLRINSTFLSFSFGRSFITTAGNDAVFDLKTASDTALIRGGIIGPGGLVKDGLGELLLSHDSSVYAGSTTINAGQLTVDEDEMIPDTSAVIINAGTLTLLSVLETIGSLEGGGTVLFADSTSNHLRIGANNTDTIFSGNIVDDPIFGSGSLSKIGNKSLTLTGTNTYSEGTTVASGRLVVDTDSLPAAGGVVNNASLEFNQTTTGTYAGVISGVGTLFKSGAGTLGLNQENTSTGPVQVLEGTLAITAGGTLASAGTLIDTGATLRIDGGTYNANGIVGINGGRLERVSGSFNLATGQTLDTNANAVVQFTGSYDLDNATTFKIEDGSDFSVTGFLDVGDITDGTLIVDGDGSTLITNTISTTFLAWGRRGGTANVTIRNNATAEINGTSIDFADNGNANSSGTLNVQSGATMTANTLNVAIRDSGTGIFNVDGMGTMLTQNGASTLTIGGSGTSVANVNVTNQATFNTGTGLTTINPTGTLTVDTDGTFNANGGIVNSGTVQLLGSQINTTSFSTGDGIFTHTGGMLTVTGGMLEVGADGYTIEGAGNPKVVLNDASLAVVGDLSVGSASLGQMTIENGSMVYVGNNVLVGYSDDSDGALIVDGGDTRLISSSQLFVGRLGSAVGAVTIQNGAKLEVDRVSIAQQDAGSGMIIVDGDGSTLTALTGINVGLQSTGQGKLTVRNGGLVGADMDFSVASGSVVELMGGQIHAGEININSGGVFNLSGGTLITPLLDLSEPGATFNFSSGILTVGAFRLSSNDALETFGGRLTFDTLTGSLINHGATVTPGNSPGVMTIDGDYQVTTTDAALEIELAGLGGAGAANGHDQLAITGAVSLGGALDLKLIDGLTPAGLNHGDLFVALTADTITGAFDQFTGDIFDLGDNKALVPVRLERITDGDEVLALVVTAPGDANLDGRVSVADFAVLQNNFDLTGQTWTDGNFNPSVDDQVSFADFAVLQNNFDMTFFDSAEVFDGFNVLPLGGGAAFSAVAVPESGTAALLGLGTLLAMRPSRRSLRCGHA